MTGKRGAGRDTLLECAATLFATAGYDGVSTKQLAAEAGLSIGALYHHFQTKHAVYCAALEWGIARLPAPDTATFDADGGAGAQLTALNTWFCSIISAQTVESRLLRLELLDPHLETLLSDLPPFSIASERFQQLIAQVMPDADPQLMIAAVVSMSFGFAQLAGLRAHVPEFMGKMNGPADIAAAISHILFKPADKADAESGL